LVACDNDSAPDVFAAWCAEAEPTTMYLAVVDGATCARGQRELLAVRTQPALNTNDLLTVTPSGHGIDVGA
jgi:hypothetical protein